MTASQELGCRLQGRRQPQERAGCQRRLQAVLYVLEVTTAHARPHGDVLAAQAHLAPTLRHPAPEISRTRPGHVGSRNRVHGSEATAAPPRCPSGDGSIFRADSVGLAGHCPHRDDVGDDEDERDDHGRLEQAGGALALAEPVNADAAEREGEQEEQAAPVGDDEADAEPGGLVDLVGQVVPVLQAVEPFARRAACRIRPGRPTSRSEK